MDNAKQFVKACSNAGLIPSRVNPSAVGGIGITIGNGDRKAFIEMYNRGNCWALFADYGTKTDSDIQTHPVPISDADFQEIIEMIKFYLSVCSSATSP